MITPIKPGSDSRKNWRTINEIAVGLAGLGYQNSDRRGAIAGMRKHPRDILADPFQLYQSGTWLQWKVTDGILITTGDPIMVTNVETLFTLTSGVARYWFYIEISSTTGTIATSATTLVWSATKIPLGWVNTTNTTDSISVPTQFYPLHLFNPCAP